MIDLASSIGRETSIGDSSDIRSAELCLQKVMTLAEENEGSRSNHGRDWSLPAFGLGVASCREPII